MKNINEYIDTFEYIMLNNINKAIINDIENGKITEADFAGLINKLNEVKNKIFADHGYGIKTDPETVIFTEVKTVVDNRKTIKKETDKIIGYTTVCQDVSVEIFEEIDVENPDFGKKFYYICGKIKTNKMKNFKKFYVA